MPIAIESAVLGVIVLAVIAWQRRQVTRDLHAMREAIERIAARTEGEDDAGRDL